MERIKIFILITLLITGCAKIVAPVGGPKDTTPPVAVKENPKNGVVNFNEKMIKITFNEFVTLNNPLENIIFSPPLSTTADYTLKGKSLVIKWKDTLRENTTYSIILADAIKDYTEGNVLSFYQYAFSTGAQIDTLQLSGMIKNAETELPEKGVFVFLYDRNIDSLPNTMRPTYLTRSNNDGRFEFKNVKQGTYKIFALKDINSNFIYDLQNEGIAFQKELVTPDTNQTITLAFFNAKDTNQKVLTPINLQKGAYKIPLKLSCKSEKSIKTTILYPPDINHHLQLNNSLDTVNYYFYEDFTDSVVLQVKLTEWNITDTLTLSPFKPPFRSNRNKTEQKLGIQSYNSGDLYKPLILNFSYPIKPNQNIETIIIKKGKETNDTITERFQVNGEFIKSFTLPYAFETKESYILIFKDSLFFGWDGTTNDSLVIPFTMKTERDYGNLMIDYLVNDENINYVIQLLDGNQKLIQQNTISKKEKITYEHLDPGNYKIKVIFDLNGNGTWDTGNYTKNLQPERILFFEKPISIRGFWDLEETFEIK
jgi:hypothetical protein